MPDDVTDLLNRLGDGDASAYARLFDRIYHELRALAQGIVGADRARTLQPTALVHEAFLQLVKVPDPRFDNRRQFYALAAKVMRAVLVDHVRAQRAQKRGGEAQALPIDSEVQLSDGGDRAIDLLDLTMAIEELAGVDAELAVVAEQSYLAGMSTAEIAAALNVVPRTAQRRLKVANSWLRDRLDGH